MERIKRAELLARFVHFNQKRQDGQEYITHPERMVLSYIRTITNFPRLEWADIDYKLLTLTEENIIIICGIWMHDIKEDAEFPKVIMLMLDTYFEGDICDLVDVLTHRSYESYNTYISQIFRNPIAWKIKWLDMEDNTSYCIPPKQKKKYTDACIMLMSHGVIIPDIIKERLGLHGT